MITRSKIKMGIIKEIKATTKKKKVIKNFRLEQDLVKKFEAKCRKNKLTQTKVVHFLLEKYVNSK